MTGFRPNSYPTWPDSVLAWRGWPDASAVATIIYAVASIATLVVLVLAAFWARAQLNELRNGRHAQTLLEMYRRWDTDPALQDSKKAGKIYQTPEELEQAVRRLSRAESSERLEMLIRVTTFFEELGVLVDKDALSFAMVNEWLGQLVYDYWERWAPAVAFARSKDGLDRDVGKNFEALAYRVAEARRLEWHGPAP